MKILKWLDKHLEESILITILCVIVFVMFYQIIRRYLFNSSLTWSEEFCRYAFIWFIFIAFPYSIRLGSELRMDAVISALPKVWLDRVKLVLTLISLCLAAFLFVQSFTSVSDAVATGEISSGLHLPKQYVYMSLVAGFGLAVIRYIQAIYKMISKKEKGGEES